MRAEREAILERGVGIGEEEIKEIGPNLREREEGSKRGRQRLVA